MSGISASQFSKVQILKFRIDRHITGVRRGIKRVPICKGVVDVEGVGVAILLTKREHGIFPSF